MTHYLIEYKDWIFVKGYGFLSFTRNMSENLKGKYVQKLISHAK